MCINMSCVFCIFCLQIIEKSDLKVLYFWIFSWLPILNWYLTCHIKHAIIYVHIILLSFLSYFLSYSVLTYTLLHCLNWVSQPLYGVNYTPKLHHSHIFLSSLSLPSITLVLFKTNKNFTHMLKLMITQTFKQWLLLFWYHSGGLKMG